MYDVQVGRWMCMDPHAEKYARYTPYAYSIDNPINYYDLDGRIVRDKDGNIVFIPLYEGIARHITDTKGAKGIYGYIFTDKFKPILVVKNISPKKSWDTDCHGQTFTKGKYWIDNQYVKNILKDDGYKQVKKSDLKVGDIVIYTDKDGNVQDSRTVSKIDAKTKEITVYGQGGLEENNYNADIDKAYESDKQEYYTRDEEDASVDKATVDAWTELFQKIFKQMEKKVEADKELKRKMEENKKKSDSTKTKTD